MGPGCPKVLIILPLCVILCSAPLLSMPGGAAGPYSAESILGFARRLYADGEYYRAHVELMRLESYYPGYLDPGSRHITGLHLLMRGGRYEDVLGCSRPSPAGPALCIDGIYRADAALFLGRYADAVALSGGAGNCPGLLAPYRWKRSFIATLMRGDMVGARRMLDISEFPSDSAETSEEEKEKFCLMIKWAERQQEAMTHPSLALFAGAVPGLGYAVAGNRPTGVVAFIVVTVFSALTVAAFRTDNAPLGLVLGASSLFFYGGSIVGGYLEAGRHNESLTKTLRDTLVMDSGLDRDLDVMFEKYSFRRKALE